MQPSHNADTISRAQVVNLPISSSFTKNQHNDVIQFSVYFQCNVQLALFYIGPFSDSTVPAAMLVLRMKMFTRDQALDHNNNIPYNIVYIQLDTACRNIVYIAAAIRMTFCNVVTYVTWMFIHLHSVY